MKDEIPSYTVYARFAKGFEQEARSILAIETVSESMERVREDRSYKRTYVLKNKQDGKETKFNTKSSKM